MMSSDELREVGSFPTTHWSLVGRASHEDPEVRRQGIAELLKRYAPALRSVLKFYHVAPSDSEDLLQGFICDAGSSIDVETKSQCAEFDNAWVRTVLQEAVDRMHNHCVKRQGSAGRRLGARSSVRRARS